MSAWLRGLRPIAGMRSRNTRLTTWPRSALSCCRSGVWATTSTVSAWAPISSLNRRLTLSWIWTMTPFWLVALNPSAETSTV